MQLKCDHATLSCFACFGILNFAHQLVIDEMLNGGSVCNNAVFVPIVIRNLFDQFIGLPDFFDNFLFSFFRDSNDLSSFSQDATASFLIIDSRKSLRGIDVGLVSTDNEFLGIDDFASILDTGVATLNLVFRVNSKFSTVPSQTKKMLCLSGFSEVDLPVIAPSTTDQLSEPFQPERSLPLNSSIGDSANEMDPIAITNPNEAQNRIAFERGRKNMERRDIGVSFLKEGETDDILARARGLHDTPNLPYFARAPRACCIASQLCLRIFSIPGE